MIPIANPLLSDKKSKKLLLRVKKRIVNCSRGIKKAQKQILTGKKGLLILSADTSPMDLITHLPALCEENGVEYVFIKRQNDLISLSPESESVSCLFVESEKSLLKKIKE